MAKISSSFQCMICKQPLNFPKNISIVEFTILMLQFWNNHELCEKSENESKLIESVQEQNKKIEENHSPG